MDEKPVAAPLTVASTADAQGNVVVWDNGPQAPVEGPDGSVSDADKARYDAELAAWKAGGGLPRPSVMAAGDATHAITVDPGRYTLEPLGVDEGAVSAKLKEIQERRANTKKLAQARLDAAELAADRKEAISAVMADQANEAAAKKAADLEAKRAGPGRPTPPKFAPSPQNKPVDDLDEPRPPKPFVPQPPAPAPAPPPSFPKSV